MSLSRPSTTPTASKTKTAAVAESWEDDISSGEDDDKYQQETQNGDETVLAPPPTPASPGILSPLQGDDMLDRVYVHPAANAGSRGGGSSPNTPTLRPEKQTAVAGRLIAGALGIRAPKKTEEQRAYEKAVKEKEIKKRNLQREAEAKAKEEAEKVKAAIWED
ncbi:MAG: hypothetical protein M1819_000097 [Sarea resinae]|nr:MAG: hypothetical protein M1819_000097 [Sarea resinae]